MARITMSKTMKLLQNKQWRKCTKSWIVEVVLVKCNLVDNRYQQKSEVPYTFALNKSYGYLLNVEPSNLVFLKTCNRVGWSYNSYGSKTLDPNMQVINCRIKLASNKF